MNRALCLIVFLTACGAEPQTTPTDSSPRSQPSKMPSEMPSETVQDPETQPNPDAKAAVTETKVTNLDVAGAAELIAANKDLVILDVRTPAEFATGHLDGAINIDFRASDFAAKVAELARDQAYLVHCRSGGRSTSALAPLRELKFAEIYHLDGGMLAWEKAGKPVAK